MYILIAFTQTRLQPLPGISCLFYSRFILDNLLSLGTAKPNLHWQPVWQICLVCSLNLTVYAKMKNMEEDAKFFKMLSNVEEEERNIRKSNNEPKLFSSTKLKNLLHKF